jgi:hypothetical protein
VSAKLRNMREALELTEQHLKHALATVQFSLERFPAEPQEPTDFERELERLKTHNAALSWIKRQREFPNASRPPCSEYCAGAEFGARWALRSQLVREMAEALRMYQAVADSDCQPYAKQREIGRSALDAYDAEVAKGGA